MRFPVVERNLCFLIPVHFKPSAWRLPLARKMTTPCVSSLERKKASLKVEGLGRAFVVRALGATLAGLCLA